jgi:glucosamine--fructose-6-phosphate aminotransferase (isomerizing)
VAPIKVARESGQNDENKRGESMANRNENAIIAQVLSLPEMIRTEFDALDEQIRLLMSRRECLSVKRIVITGCGDSHMAGLAAELAFEQLAGIPTEPMRAMKAGRYASPYVMSHHAGSPLVIGISVSGTVARTREALGLFARQGYPTIAITGNPESPLAQLAEKVVDCTIPEYPFAPGVRNYRMSLLSLYLLAIRLGEVQHRYSPDDAARLRQSLRGTADAIEATIERIGEETARLARALAGEKSFVFVGDGPNFATALFGAAKVIEAAGRHAMGQESEEWAHLQIFSAVETATPTFLISPGYRGHDRVGDLLGPLKRIGRTTIAVVPEGDELVGPPADWLLPVTGQVLEAFTPMIYPVAAEMFAAHLADVAGEQFFRLGNPRYDPRLDARDTPILTEVKGSSIVPNHLG